MGVGFSDLEMKEAVEKYTGPEISFLWIQPAVVPSIPETAGRFRGAM